MLEKAEVKAQKELKVDLMLADRTEVDQEMANRGVKEVDVVVVSNKCRQQILLCWRLDGACMYVSPVLKQMKSNEHWHNHTSA